jgi:hypothetical protein
MSVDDADRGADGGAGRTGAGRAGERIRSAGGTSAP